MKIWIYNDTSCTKLLQRGSLLYQEGLPDLLIEISPGAAFEYNFGFQSSSGFPGICGLKSPDTTINDLIVSVGEDYPPIVFSPNPELSPAILGSCIGDVLRDESISGGADLFLELSMVESLLPWLSAASQIGFLLDISAAPEDELVEQVQKFVERGLIAPEKWIGLRVYDSKDGSFTNGDQAAIKRLGLEKVDKASAL
jgi:hypothetical protein